MILHRRSFLTGLIGLISAPAIVHYSNLMPVKVVKGLIIPDAPTIESPYRLFQRVCAGCGGRNKFNDDGTWVPIKRMPIGDGRPLVQRDVEGYNGLSFPLWPYENGDIIKVDETNGRTTHIYPARIEK